MRGTRWQQVVGESLRWLLLAVTVVVLNFPLAITAITSIKPDAAINAAPPTWSFTPTLQHYEAVLSDRTLDFPLYLLNSTLIALGGTALALVLAIPAAYAIVRHGIGRRTILPLVANLRAIPLVIFAIPFYLMYQVLGLLDTRTGLALIECIVNLPLALLVSVAMIQDLPVEVEEAARVDGAGTLRVLTRIVVPMARPMIAAVAILSFIYAWNEFLFGLILTTSKAVPVTVAATFFTTTWGVRWGATAAAMTLSLLPPVVLGLLSYRSLGRIMAGAVRG
jgi:multiple sugar transport system permease protein